MEPEETPLPHRAQLLLHLSLLRSGIAGTGYVVAASGVKTAASFMILRRREAKRKEKGRKTRFLRNALS